jgi:hypothetical protein
LLCIAINIPFIADFVFEPYLVATYGAEAMVSFSTALLYSSLVGLLIYIVLVKYKAKIEPIRQKLLLFCALIGGMGWIFYVVAGWEFIFWFTVLSSPLSHILQFTFISILIDSTPKQNRSGMGIFSRRRISPSDPEYLSYFTHSKQSGRSLCQ